MSAIVYADFFADESQSSLMLRLVTALAEGTDTIAAEAGCSIGYRLEVILPFEQENYQQDFQGEALAHFKRLVAQAKSKHRAYQPAPPSSRAGRCRGQEGL